LYQTTHYHVYNSLYVALFSMQELFKITEQFNKKTNTNGRALMKKLQSCPSNKKTKY